jgi:hypothetical protein
MVEALLKTGKHTITAISRANSTSKIPEGVQVRKVDYDNQSSVVEALRGQDALIITMGVMAPKDQQSKLIEAAAEAKVPWVFPNQWGIDPGDESLAADTFMGGLHKKAYELIKELGQSSYISVTCGFWYEWSLAIPVSFGFDFKNRVVTLYDEGETTMSISTWPQVGRGLASILSLKVHREGENDTSPCLDDFKNGHIYFNSFTVGQKDMLESVLRVTKTSIDDWKVTKEPVKSRYAAGVAEMQKGDRLGFAKLLYARAFYPNGGGNFEKTRGLQNDILGLPKEDIDEYTKLGIKRQDDTNGTGYE